MRQISRYLRSLLLIAALAAPAVATGCAVRGAYGVRYTTATTATIIGGTTAKIVPIGNTWEISTKTIATIRS
jgi:hypothetical protein